MGHLGYFFNVADADNRIAGGFDINHFGILSDCIAYRFQIGGIYQAYVNAESRQVKAKQFLCPGVTDF